MSEDTNRELDKLLHTPDEKIHTEDADLHTPLHTDLHTLHTQLQSANNRINELSALLYQLLEQMDSDLFSDQLTNSNRQNLIRVVKQRIVLTPEILEIVNKSKQQQEQTVNT